MTADFFVAGRAILAVKVLDKNGDVTGEYKWQTVREVDSDESGNPMEICLE